MSTPTIRRRPMSRERVSDENAERVMLWLARERLWDELIESACPEFVPEICAAADENWLRIVGDEPEYSL